MTQSKSQRRIRSLCIFRGQGYGRVFLCLGTRAREGCFMSGLGSHLWTRQRSRYSDCLRAGRSGNQIRFAAPVQIGPETRPASCTMGNGSFQGIRCGRGVTLTPHPFQCRGQKQSTAILLLSLRAFVAYDRVKPRVTFREGYVLCECPVATPTEEHFCMSWNHSQRRISGVGPGTRIREGYAVYYMESNIKSDIFCAS